MWLSENVGSFLGFTHGLKIWTRAGKIKVSADKQVNMWRPDILFPTCVLLGVNQLVAYRSAINAIYSLCSCGCVDGHR